MNRREREDLERRIEAVAAAFAANVERLRAAHRPGRAAFRTEVLDVVEALNHPVVSDVMHDAAAAAFASGHGVGPGALMSECFGCRAAWGRRAPPVAALLITRVGTDTGALALLCPACVAAGPEGLEPLIRAGLERDFGLEDVERLPLSTFAPGGHA